MDYQDSSLDSLKQSFDPLGYNSNKPNQLVIMDSYAYDLVYGDTSMHPHIKPQDFLPSVNYDYKT